MAQAPLVIKQQLLPLTKTYGTGNRRLFITLHQTGGPQNGLNAQWMANYQRDMSAPSNAEQKSWHYQVDDKEAIQSFSHDVHTWQAGKSMPERIVIYVMNFLNCWNILTFKDEDNQQPSCNLIEFA